ncbi:NADH-ubiquinone oxidoreductase chain 5-like [Cataglyphis hispanica]|uniref:NADH-ubiquinone oxidoreductase chain 5-like n=1 Tax=Cataglyphis hispanica TaxID=1086592 RepID=UPI002180069D|nr:NADH-ubiquinone oxidoreductase chain 5-like [Cataglyphis hispanica]
MAAPTPVSALVHSSTLVTAGVYLLIRFNKILIERIMDKILLYLSIFTIFISSLIANFENDFKKIIALSTLRQLGLIIIILRLGLNLLSFFHLLTHAIFKSLLFICAGIIIHLMNNNQDIRFCGKINEYIPFTIIRFYISRLALIGFPFLTGFYSKDLIIESVYIININISLLILRILSLSFTISYSFRLFYYIYFGEVNRRGFFF